MSPQRKKPVCDVRNHRRALDRLITIAISALVASSVYWVPMLLLCRGNSYSEVIAANPVVQGVTSKNFGIT